MSFFTSGDLSAYMQPARSLQGPGMHVANLAVTKLEQYHLLAVAAQPITDGWQPAVTQ
jgi:hypothetical protein